MRRTHSQNGTKLATSSSSAANLRGNSKTGAVAPSLVALGHNSAKAADGLSDVEPLVAGGRKLGQVRIAQRRPNRRKVEQPESPEQLLVAYLRYQSLPAVDPVGFCGGDAGGESQMLDLLGVPVGIEVRTVEEDAAHLDLQRLGEQARRHRLPGPSARVKEQGAHEGVTEKRRRCAASRRSRGSAALFSFASSRVEPDEDALEGRFAYSEAAHEEAHQRTVKVTVLGEDADKLDDLSRSSLRVARG